VREREVAIVRRYLDGELDFPRGSEALARAMPGIAADDVLKFANQYRTYLATYSIGADAVNEWLNRQAPSHDRRARWVAYQALVTAPGQTIQ